MLSIKDVVALAKAGYKPADVKELMEMSKEVPQEEPAPVAPEVKPEEAPAENVMAQAMTGKPAKPDPVVTTTAEEPKEPEIDYKAKYNELLEANRKAALTRDNSGSEPQQKTAEEIVNEALIGLLS